MPELRAIHDELANAVTDEERAVLAKRILDLYITLHGGI
jgi:hypothetical protein